jgi:hypothetical protein
MNDLVSKLVNTAAEMVDGARSALRDTGHPSPEAQQLYIPVIVGKSNLKVTIESGPLTEAANAILSAQVKSRQHPSMSREDAIHKAAHCLLREAALLKETHTIPSDPENWRGDEDAKDNHDEMIAIAKRLLMVEP